MGILKRVFSAPDTVDSVIDGAKKGLDALVFTNEERGAMGLEAFGLVIEYMKATQSQNLARRYIAFLIVALWGFLILLGVTVLLLGQWLGWESDPAALVFGVIGDHVGTPLMIVLGFYYATHTLRAWAKPEKK